MHPRLLDLATGVALSRMRRAAAAKQFHFGAVGLRNDGPLVASYNERREIPSWEHHAEARLCRKLTPHSVVAVVRLTADAQWAMARPCASCIRCMRRRGVRRVYYSVGPGEYGVLTL